MRGEVIFPSDNRAEVHADTPSRPRETRKFKDVSCFFTPELQHHLQGDHDGWISTWNPHVQLGRPSIHTHGLSPAYPLTRLLALFSSDALVVYTAQVITTVLLTAVFGFLFLRALGLEPPAAFVGASGLALGITASLFSSFAVFLATPCWTLCLGWLLVRFIERPTSARGLGIAFCVYALAISAYPQHVVWDFYLLGLLALMLLARKSGAGSRRRILLWLAAASVVGVLAAFPVLLDVASAALRSSRRETYEGYLDRGLLRFEGPADVLRFFGLLVDPFWFGNPLHRNASTQSPGFGLGALFASLFALSWMDGLWRRTWPWLGFCAVGLGLTLWRPAYDFAARFLGLGISVSSPMRGAWIAAYVCAAIALDHLLRGGFPRRRLALAVAALPLLPLAATVRAWDGNVLLGLVAFALAWLVVALRRTWFAVLVAVLTTIFYAGRLVDGWPRDDVVFDSPIVEQLRERTPEGARYLIVEPLPAEFLPPNQEALLGLRSVHSYDPLVSELYKRLTEERFDVDTREYRKRFTRAQGTTWMRSPELALTDVNAVVTGAETKLAARLERLAEVDGIFVCRPPWEPLARGQFTEFGLADGVATIDLERAEEARAALELLEEHDDSTRLRCTALPATSLVFLSRQFHPDWRARAAGRELETVRVDDFYLGVMVPAGTDEIELEFRPWARYAWIPQVFFAAAALALALARLRRRARPADA